MAQQYPESLSAWLAQIEACHPKEIEMGLERIRQVAERLPIDLSESRKVVIAGTNGKGSTTTLLDSVLRQAGYSTGVFTSPHFLRYNERIRLNGQEVEDWRLCEVFTQIEQARGEIPLTYFEYGTLAALLCFSQTRPDVVLLEVGLGGRLDAVNIIDADIALLTTVSLDHTDWLGTDREQIGREKAGVFRAGRPAVCGEADTPASVLAVAADVGADLLVRGRDYGAAVDEQADLWGWWGVDAGGGRLELNDLPRPGLPLVNAISVVQALQLLGLPRLQGEAGLDAVRQGLIQARMTGRLQQVVLPKGRAILDVAHNPESAQYLARWLQANPCAGQTHLLIGMLEDKDIDQVIDLLQPQINCWHAVTLTGRRGSPSQRISVPLRERHAREAEDYASVAEAVAAVVPRLTDADRLVVAGSFVTVAQTLDALGLDG